MTDQPNYNTITAVRRSYQRWFGGEMKDQPDYAVFGHRIADLLRAHEDWFSDEWSREVMPIAAECGLAELVPYDPSEHGDLDAEPGTDVWIWRSEV